MTLEQNSAKKAKTHTVYRNKAGERVPGCTTITGVMDKPALIAWANKLGLEGIEVKKYVDDLADIGKCAHYMAECHIKSKITGIDVDPELDDYTKNQIESANNSFGKFLEWEKVNEVKYLASEMELVSETHQFGGQIDVFCIINGKKTLLDIKTCKGIWPEMHTQVGGGYKLLLEDNRYKVEDVVILRIGRDDVEGFEVKQVPLVEKHMERFLICKQLYDINKIVNKK